MSELSKQALKVENNTSFPNNNSGEISAADLRAFNVDMIDSLVDEITYNADSASWNQQINALEQFTSSQQPSFTALNQFTASQLTINSGVNAFTQSANGRLTALESETANIEAWTASVNQIADNGIVQGTSTRLHFYGLVSASIVQNVGGPIASILIEQDGTKLDSASFNSFTQSFNSFSASVTQSIVDLQNFSASLSGGFVTEGELQAATASLINQINTKTDTSSFNAYTSQANNRLTNLEAATASIDSSISQLNASSASQQISINALNVFTASQSTASIVSSITNLNAFTQSANIRLNNLETTSASVNTSITNINAYTQSNDLKWQDLGSKSGSWITESETGSFARWDVSNPWSANQNFTNITAFSASFTYVQTVFETASVIYSSGSNQFGDELTDTQTLSGSVKVQGSLTVNGVPVQTSSVDISALNQATQSLQAFTASQETKNTTLESVTSSLQAFTSSANSRLNNLEGATSSYAISSSVAAVDAAQQSQIDALINATSSYADSASFAASQLAQDIRIDSLSSLTASVNNSITSLNGFTASADSRLNNLESATSSYAISASVAAVDAAQQVQINSLINATGSYVTETESGSFLITASFASQTLTFTKGDGTTFGVVIPDISGSTIDTGSFVTTSSFNAYTQSNDQRVSSLEANSASVNTSITNLNSATQSLFTSASLGLTTASVSLNTITFSKGDGSTFNLTVDTGSGGGGGTTFEKPSIQTVSGSVLITANSFTSGAANIAHISASSQNQANLLFKTNNNAGSTIVSGSLNIYANGSAPAAGRLNYLENSNIFLNDSGFLPTVTASVLAAGGFYPRMRSNMWLGTGPWTINTNAFASSSTQAGSYNNNLFLGSTGTTINTLGNTSGPAFSHNILAQAAVTINAPSRSLAQIAAGASGSTVVSFLNNAAFGGSITYNGPVSASNAQSHTISGNSVQGTLTLNLQSGSRAHSITNNILNGTLTVNDNTVFTPTLGGTTTISQTNINGSITLTNRASASFNLTANNLGGFTISNDYDSSTNGTTGRSFVLQGNVMLGFLANNIYFSGSAAGTGTTNDRGRGFYGNLIGGSRISASVIGDGNRHFLASAVWGQGLSVYGTGLYDASNATLAGGQNGGSAFFGRWNAEDGNRANTAETVFAVGTGNSGSAGIVRKTGFLIDSGSNTFVEGTLNVSGSSTLSGSLYIQSGSTLPVSTGSAILTWNAATGQVNQASFSTIVSASVSSAEFWSTTTQSGSAGVSGSIQFNNSGSFYNVSLVNGTQLTVGNAGVYNIQFSAQVETSAGADTVYIWFKKNGTNIGDSASKAVLANNTAQVITVNILDQAVANDYYEIAYQNLNGHATVLAEAASGNIPAIPSVIATIFQIR